MILGTSLRHRLNGVAEMMDAAAMFRIMGPACAGRGWD